MERDRHFIRHRAEKDWFEVPEEEAYLVFSSGEHYVTVISRSKRGLAQHDAVLRQIELWLLYLQGEYPVKPARIKDFLSVKPDWTIGAGLQDAINSAVTVKNHLL